MKKLLLASMLSVICSSSAFAQAGYLTDGYGSVVKSGFGLCWNTSATKIPNAECGDVIEQPKKIDPPLILKPHVIPGLEDKIQVKKQKVIINAEVLFKFDSAELSNVGESVLVSKVVAINPTSVEVIGYTDSIGTQKYNLKLSKKRAEAVKKFLVSKGIAEDKIFAVGMGENNLVCEEKNPTKSSKCSAKNRRVEVTTEYSK